MDKLKIGVIGVGIMGERHCRVYSQMRGVTLIGINDLDESRGQMIATKYDTNFYQDYIHLLTNVDAVSIATTTPSHFPLVSKALEYGIHVLVEKPIAETVEQAQKLTDLADRHHKLLQIGHIERFNPAFTELKNVVDGKKIVGINIRRLSPFDTSNTDVDVIRDLMIHDFDLLLNLAGDDFEGLNAWGRSSSTTAIDHAVANFSFREGPIATLFASRITEQKVRKIEIVAEGAYIEADLLGKSLKIHRHTLPQFYGADKYRQESIIERIHVPMAEPLMLELQHFVNAVRTNQIPLVSGKDGVKSIQLAQSVTEQIKQANNPQKE